MVKPIYVFKLDILNRNKKLCLALIILQVLVGFFCLIASIYLFALSFSNIDAIILLLIFLVFDYQIIAVVKYNITNF